MPSKILSLLLCFYVPFTMTARAQTPRRVTLNGMDGASAPAETIDVRGAAGINTVPAPMLEIYPAAKKPSHGTIMICPGGAYSFLVTGKEGRDVATMLNEAGWDAAVLLYHVNAGPDTRALALDDAEKALALLQKRGGEFGLSTRQIGVMGFSAGGHLAARLAHETAPGGTAPAFLVLMYPAYLERDGKLLTDVTPIDAPVFLYVGDQDKTFYPSSVAFHAACQEKGIRCDYGVALNVGHGFGYTANLPAGARDWPDKLKAFLASLDPKP